MTSRSCESLTSDVFISRRKLNRATALSCFNHFLPSSHSARDKGDMPFQKIAHTEQIRDFDSTATPQYCIPACSEVLIGPETQRLDLDAAVGCFWASKILQWGDVIFLLSDSSRRHVLLLRIDIAT